MQHKRTEQVIGDVFMPEKVAVLIEVTNITYAFDSIKEKNGIPYAAKLDFSRLVSIVTSGKDVVSKAAYIGTVHGQRRFNQKRFFCYFRNNGFDIRTKSCKMINLGNGRRKSKANFDVEISLDAMEAVAENGIDEIVLISGDSDYAYLVRKVQGLNCRITVVASRSTVSEELLRMADRVVLVDNLDMKDITFVKGRHS